MALDNGTTLGRELLNALEAVTGLIPKATSIQDLNELANNTRKAHRADRDARRHEPQPRQSRISCSHQWSSGSLGIDTQRDQRHGECRQGGGDARQDTRPGRAADGSVEVSNSLIRNFRHGTMTELGYPYRGMK